MPRKLEPVQWREREVNPNILEPLLVLSQHVFNHQIHVFNMVRIGKVEFLFHSQ